MGVLSKDKQLDRIIYGGQPAVARCAFCPEFAVHGTAEEVTQAGVDHRASVHPELKVKRVKGLTGRPCVVGLCEQRSVVKRGKLAGYCAYHRDESLAEEKRQAHQQRVLRARVRAEEAARQRALKPKVRPSRRASNGSGSSVPHPMHIINDERVDEIVRLYTKEGLSAISIAREFWEKWGYRSEQSMTASVYHVLDLRSVPRRSRSESARLTYQREGPRPYAGGQQSFITDARWDAVHRLIEAGCSILAIARLAYERWGYKSADSCRDAMKRKAISEGKKLYTKPMVEIPEISRRDALALLEEAG